VNSNPNARATAKSEFCAFCGRFHFLAGAASDHARQVHFMVKKQRPYKKIM
jgi:hypothetical protein